MEGGEDVGEEAVVFVCVGGFQQSAVQSVGFVEGIPTCRVSELPEFIMFVDEWWEVGDGPCSFDGHGGRIRRIQSQTPAGDGGLGAKAEVAWGTKRRCAGRTGICLVGRLSSA